MYRHGLGLSLLLVAVGALKTSDGQAAEPDGKMRVYIGTYTGSGSKGIYRFILDPATGKLTEEGVTTDVVNPSFLAVHPSRKFLYSVAEVEDYEGKKAGGVRAFAIDPKTGDLKPLNGQPSGGGGPCHVVVDPAGKNVLVANYGGGSASVFPIREDGSLGKATAFVQHSGSSVNKSRQEKPHAHSVNVDKAGRFAVVADLGLDQCLVYKLDPDTGTLEANDPPAVSVEPGSGPRHFAFHPSGKFAYVINEMASTLTALDYDADKGTLKPVQTLSTLPKGYDGKDNSTAEVQVHPSGKFVYGSNRGHNSIAIFAVDPKTGKLTHIGNESTQGKIPRNFGIDPTGSFLLAANQDSGTVVVFRIDPQTGLLKATGSVVEAPKACCVKFLEME